MATSLVGLDAGLADAARGLDLAVHQSGLQGRFTSTLRTSAEQKRLYDNFLAGHSSFPAVPPGFSAHEYGLAFDYLVSPWDYQSDVGAYWQSLGGGWSPSDAVHFELPGATAAVKAFAESQLEASGTTIVGRVRAEAHTFSEWVNALPWYIQVLLPAAATVSEYATSKATFTKREFEKILTDAGLI